MAHTFNLYYLTKRLARKASHEIYLSSTVHEPERKVLLKIYDARCCRPDIAPENFHYCASKFKRLSHPHIVPILDIGIEEGKPYVVCEYFPMGSLRQHLERVAPEHFRLDTALALILEVGSALSYAHSQNLVHQKVKPENVFLNAQGQALLTDFSLHEIINERVLESQPDESVINYMPPEQLAGSVSPSSDQYALACLFYELITGKSPFPAGDLSYLWQRDTILSPTPPSRFMTTLPKQVERVILDALSKEPEDRYTDVAAFLAVLEEAVRSASLRKHFISGSGHQAAGLIPKGALLPASSAKPAPIQVPMRKEPESYPWSPPVGGAAPGQLVARPGDKYQGTSHDLLKSAFFATPTIEVASVQAQTDSPAPAPIPVPASLHGLGRIEPGQPPPAVESPPVPASPVLSLQLQALPVAQHFPLGKRLYVLLSVALVCIMITAFFSTSNKSISSWMNAHVSVLAASVTAGHNKPSVSATPMPVQPTPLGALPTPTTNHKSTTKPVLATTNAITPASLPTPTPLPPTPTPLPPTPTPLPPTPTPTSNGQMYYNISNENSGMLLDVTGASKTAGANVIQQTNNGVLSQQWKRVSVGGGYFNIVNTNSGLLLDVTGSSATAGAYVIQATSNGGADQQWKFVPVGGGYFNIVNRNSGLLLDVTGSSTTSGTRIIQWNSTGATSQQWKLNVAN